MENSSGETWDSFLHYLPYSEEDEKIGMVCTTAGSVEVPPHTVYPPGKNQHPALFRQVAEGRILPEFQIVYVTRGEGIFGVGGRTHRVMPGSLLLVLPGIKHFYKPVFETGWHEYWAGFKGGFYSKLMEEGILSPEHVFFDVGIHNDIVTIFERILYEVRTQQPLYQLKACSGILSLIAEMLTHERRSEQPNYYQKIVEKAKYLMETNIFKAINVSSISEQIGVSSTKLNEIFKIYTSMTPYQYYIHIKIHKAEDLLEQDNVTVKEVAFSLGFEDQYYFSRLFKNKTGIAPSDWKIYIRQGGNYAGGKRQYPPGLVKSPSSYI
ncbi:MAG: helix-turn-helix domain-containing protein [Spirochaetaceae bacterium]|jgi:AraC-like DNA-binding protein|nr:helix-turn-helix domain-containing protein [Spirochaetaceae bacterium]